MSNRSKKLCRNLRQGHPHVTAHGMRSVATEGFARACALIMEQFEGDDGGVYIYTAATLATDPDGFVECRDDAALLAFAHENDALIRGIMSKVLRGEKRANNDP